MKLTLFIFIIMSYTTHASTINLLHYNIKELDSSKTHSQNKQIKAVKDVIKNYDIDILSLNEIQYDFKENNLLKLNKLLDLNLNNYSFNPANTGMNSSKNKPDLVNFGTIPAQYSTGALFKYEKVNELVISKLRWIDFNPSINPSQFKDSYGKALPKDMPLFDKNFSDVTIKVDNKQVHLILLHTVPAYHFGNSNSPNYQRNTDQLRFLEWYLTGKTDFKVNLEISPIKKDDLVIAVGDWNTEYANKENAGSYVLKRLFKTYKPFIDPKDFTFTNEGQGFDNPFRLMLDYAIVSKNINIIEGKIIHPDFNNLTEYKTFKEASDHYPIYLKITI